MFSRLLIKLIDQAITPAILLVCVRVLSVILISNHYDIDFKIESTGFAFSTNKAYILVNSFSILSMVIVLTTGLLYILFKSYVFHDTHITPSLTAKLFTLRLSSLIQSSMDLYSQGAIWLSYLFLLTLTAAVMAFFGIIYSWVFYVAFVLSIISTILLIVDVEDEIHMEKVKEPEYDESYEFLDTKN